VEFAFCGIFHPLDCYDCAAKFHAMDDKCTQIEKYQIRTVIPVKVKQENGMLEEKVIP
jgi:hypothetical protein